jgi:D-alanyl-D-alanine dipeptidase
VVDDLPIFLHRLFTFRSSGHSRGSTVDLTLVALPAREQPPYVPGQPLVDCTAPVSERFPDNTIDMGTGYDCFDTLAHTLDPRVQGEQLKNRLLLKEGLERQGLEKYEYEWWQLHLQAGDPPGHLLRLPRRPVVA